MHSHSSPEGIVNASGVMEAKRPKFQRRNNRASMAGGQGNFIEIASEQGLWV